MAKGSVIDMSDLKTDDILALTRRIASIWLAKLNLLPLTQSKGSWVCRKPPPFPSEYQPTPPPRSIRIPNTNSKRGLERLDPFHSMHYEFPSFTAHDFFDDDERQARVPRKWTDILGGPAEATLPLRYDWLLNSPGRSNIEYSQNGGFCMMWTKLWQQRRFGDRKKLWETVSPSNKVMPISFETWRRWIRWPIIKTTGALGLTKCRKRDNGWKSKKKYAGRVKT